MHYSTERILVTHAGSLPRPPDLRAAVVAKTAGEPYDSAALDRRLADAVAEVVRQQIAAGIDIVNDGELSKFNFTDYVRGRIAGYETRPSSGRRRLSIIARDERKFADYFAVNTRAQTLGPPTMPVCVERLRYVGQAELKKDLRQFYGGAQGRLADRRLPAPPIRLVRSSTGSRTHYYESDEEFRLRHRRGDE